MRVLLLIDKFTSYLINILNAISDNNKYNTILYNILNRAQYASSGGLVEALNTIVDRKKSVERRVSWT